jgi:hypothetical protein
VRPGHDNVCHNYKILGVIKCITCLAVKLLGVLEPRCLWKFMPMIGLILFAALFHNFYWQVPVKHVYISCTLSCINMVKNVECRVHCLLQVYSLTSKL